MSSAIRQPMTISSRDNLNIDRRMKRAFVEVSEQRRKGAEANVMSDGAERDAGEFLKRLPQAF